MKKLIVGLVAASALALAPSGASAHYGMHSYDALMWTRWNADTECWARGCNTSPAGINDVWAASEHTWDARVGFLKLPFTYCELRELWYHGRVILHQVSC